MLKMYYVADLTNKKLQADIERALRWQAVSIEDLSHRFVVLDTLSEGQGYLEYRAAVAELQTLPWFSINRCAWINNIFHDDPQSNIYSIPYYMANFANLLVEFDWSTIQRDRAFVCLIRHDRPSRRLIAKHILDNFPTEQYRLSYRSGLTAPEYDEVIERMAPILLDGAYLGEQFNGYPGGGILNCLINLVVETSSQLDYNHTGTWNSVFITEKTFKAFGWCQMPLWLAVPGLVAKVRAAGFDVFDDWFESHSYDAIDDQQQRFAVVFDLLHKAIDRINFQGGAEQVSQNLWPRFQHNIKVLQRLDQHNKQQFQSIVQNLSVNHELRN